VTDLSAITIFIDRAISQKAVPEALREAGAIVELHIDHFEPESPDVEWLPIVSHQGWVVLTKDSRIGRNPMEVLAISQANARVFILASGNLNLQDMATLLVDSLEKMVRLTQGNQAPFIAKIYKDRRVTIWKSRNQLLKLLKQQEQSHQEAENTDSIS
jgi:predicted nuclease of predicted toxin-antitoxin system